MSAVPGEMRVLDVCSGYSASTLAWEGLGFRHVGYAEIDAFPRAVLQARHGAVAVDWDHRWQEGSNITPLFGDFTKIEAHHVGPVDLLTGGTPCQSFSVAGKRLGLDDPRGNLTLEFLALARRLRVPWLVWENVPGFLSHDEGRTMGTFLRFLGECGYAAAWRVLDVQYVRVDGAERALPQRRRRLFVVGHLGDGAGPAAVLFERESLRGNPAPRREAGQGFAPAVAPSLVSSGRGVERIGETRGQDPVIVEAFGGGNCSGPIDAAACLTAKGQRVDFEIETFVAETAATLTRGAESAGNGGYAGRRQEDEVNMVAHALRAEGFDASEDGTGRGTPIVPVYSIQAGALRENPESGPDGVGVQADHAYTLEARSEVQAVAYDLRGREGGAQFEGPHDTANIRAASGGSSRSYVAEQWAVRRLTPTECHRLMGVPDGFLNITYRGKPAADGPIYKALGNSQGTNVMRWIGRGLIDVIRAQEAA